MSAAKRVVLRVAVLAAVSRATAGRLASLTTVALPETTPAPPGPALKMTTTPLRAPLQTAIAARQATDSDVCGTNGVDTYSCYNGWCSTVFVQETGFVGCCQSLACTIYTSCYDRSDRQTSSRPDDQALTCSGSVPDCITFDWNGGSMMGYGCTSSTTTTSSGTSRPPTGQDDGDATETGVGPTQTPDTDSSDKMTQDLTRDQKIGIGVGCSIAGVVFAGIVSYCLCFSRKRRQQRLERKLAPNGVTVPAVKTKGLETGRVPASDEAEKYAAQPVEGPVETEQFLSRPNRTKTY